MLLCPSLLLLLLLSCKLLLWVDLFSMLWGPSRHLGSLTAANWGSFSSCRGYSLINTLKLKKKVCRNPLLDTAAQKRVPHPAFSAPFGPSGVLPECYFGHLHSICYIKCQIFRARCVLYSGSRRDFFQVFSPAYSVYGSSGICSVVV